MKFKNILVYIVGMCSILIIAYGLTFFSKWISYNFMYEDFVRQTIVEMVKEDALSDSPD